MKRLAICFALALTAVTGDLAACPPPPPPRAPNAEAVCGRDGPTLCNCPAGGGFGGQNGAFLEGASLEGRRFEVKSGTTGSAFPPTQQTVLQDTANCENPPFELTIQGCESGTTARACQVLVTKGPANFGICGRNVKLGVGVAIVEGYWSKGGSWQPGNQKVVTVSCNAEASPDENQDVAYDGAITRCVKDRRFAPKGSNEDLTACIRMERADYCGDGSAHTYAGTNIDVYTKNDSPSKNTTVYGDPTVWNDCVDGRCFEATWDTDGAICVAHARWTNFPFGPTTCPKLSDPVVVINGNNGVNGNIYCRKGQKPSLGNYMTRSRRSTCDKVNGKTSAECSSANSPDADCPGCSGNGAAKAEKKGGKKGDKDSEKKVHKKQGELEPKK